MGEIDRIDDQLRRAFEGGAWHEGVRRRLAGERVELSAEEDWPPIGGAHEAAWREALAGLERTYAELRTALSHLTDARLLEMAPGKDHSLYVMLHGLIQHDLYHAGQIALLKKAWS